MSGGRDVARRVQKLKATVEQLARRQVVALVLELPEAPAGTEALPDGRCVLLGLGDTPSRHAVLEALKAGEAPPEGTLLLEYKPVAAAFIADAAGLAPSPPKDSELLATSPRGEGKSQAALGALLAHAIVHKARGFAGRCDGRRSGAAGPTWSTRWGARC